MSSDPSFLTAENALLSRAKKDIPANSPIPHKNPSASHIRRRKLSTWDTLLYKMLDEGHHASTRILLWAVFDGVLVGTLVGIFRLITSILIGYVRDLYKYIRTGHWLWLIVVVAVCLVISLFVAWITKTAPLTAYSGAADVEERLHSFEPSWWNWFRLLWRKFIGGALALSSGLYLGCEGPAIQMGATVGLAITDLTKFTKIHRRELVAAGLAAGLSAAFTAPIAGTLFLIEGDYLNRNKFQYPFQTVLISFAASISSGYITLLILGSTPDFVLVHPMHLPLRFYWELIPVGIVCGILGYAYEKTLAWGVRIYDKLRIPHKLRMFIPLVLSIPIGLYLPATLGDGSFLTKELSARAAEIPIWLLFAYMILRLIFAQISYGCGAPSGIFLPICSLGIIYGIFCGKILVSLHLGSSNLPFYSLMGVGCIGGLFASVIKRPLTAVVLAIEVTSFNDLRVIAILTAISYFTTGFIDKVDKRIADKYHKVSKSVSQHNDGNDNSNSPQNPVAQDNLYIQNILNGSNNPHEEKKKRKCMTIKTFEEKYPMAIKAEKEYKETEEKMSKTSDNKEIKKLAMRHAELEGAVECLRELRNMHQDLQAALELEKEDPSFEGEVKETEEKISHMEEELKKMLYPKDPDDAKNVIMEIKAGTGGEEAALFAADLMRMYLRYAQIKAWQVQIQSQSPSQLGGIKDVQIAFRAKNVCNPSQGVWANLKYEGGVHRVQRVPVTESQGRIQTSAAGVLVFPEVEEDDEEIEIDPKDLKIDTFMSSGPGGQSVNTTYSAVRMTHIPTGIVVNMQNEKSQIQNRAAALRVLKSRLLSLRREEEAAKASDMRHSQVRSLDRSERIRTYNFPENRIVDHRTGYKAYDLDQVMEGHLQDVIDSGIRMDEKAKIAKE